VVAWTIHQVIQLNPGGVRGWPPARQDAATRQATAAGRDGQADCQSDARRTARRDDALDGPGRALAAAAGDGARRVRIDTQAQKLIAVPRSISQESTRLASTPTAAGTGMLKPKAETLP
jgi:hypothetical protein